jgi:hypothetical protein
MAWQLFVQNKLEGIFRVTGLKVNNKNEQLVETKKLVTIRHCHHAEVKCEHVVNIMTLHSMLC